MKKMHKNMTLGMSMGMCFGVAIGCTWGESVFGNTGTGLAMGMCVGMCVGMCIGMAVGAAKDNAVNRQLEEQGYTIKDIQPSSKNNEYSILIINRKGEEKIVTVSKGQMEAENLSVGDIVYLDEDGNLEQAYDDDKE